MLFGVKSPILIPFTVKLSPKPLIFNLFIKNLFYVKNDYLNLINIFKLNCIELNKLFVKTFNPIFVICHTGLILYDFLNDRSNFIDYLTLSNDRL